MNIKFIEGQWAWSIAAGWAKVEITNGDTYLVSHQNESYDEEGKLYDYDRHPSLFHTDVIYGTKPPTDWDSVLPDTKVAAYDAVTTRKFGARFVTKITNMHTDYPYVVILENGQVTGWKYCEVVC